MTTIASARATKAASKTKRNPAAMVASVAPAKKVSRKPMAESAPVPPVTVVSVKPSSSKRKHAKLVRDSFTIPKSEYAVLESLKQRTISLAQPAKKSELLRACIAALAAMSDKALLASVAEIPSLKTGRPKRTAYGID